MTHLQGGIEKYLQEFPDGGYWQGKNFVFDKREAIGVGCFEGVGGVIQAGKNPNLPKEKPKKTSSAEVKEAVSESAEVKAEVMGRCCVCEAPWDRYVGKKKCTMCGVPVLLCVACSSAKGMLDKAEKTAATSTTTADSAAAPDKSAEASESATADAKKDSTGKLSKRQRIKAVEAEKKRIKEEQLQQRLRVLRCPLCVAENITVPADQIVFTANGTRAVHLSAMEESEGGGYYEHSAVSASNKMPTFTAPASAQPANKKIKFGDSGAEVAAPTVAKAAATVCKWGGGYSAREEKGKTAKKRKGGVTVDADGGVQRINRPCMYGKECTRGDACWFQH